MYRHLSVPRPNKCFGFLANLLKNGQLCQQQDVIHCRLSSKHYRDFQTYNHALAKSSTCCTWQCLRTSICYSPPVCLQHRMLHASFMCKDVHVRLNEVISEYHKTLMNGGFAPEAVVAFTDQLCLAMYTDLEWLPWLHAENRAICYLQLLMNDQIDSLLTKPLYGHRHFEAIYDTIFRNLDKIPVQHCPSILRSLIYCGLEQTDPIVVALLSNCYDATKTADIACLRDLTFVMQTTKGRNFPLAGKIVQRLSEILNSSESLDFSIDDMCTMVPITANFMSSELLERCKETVLAKMRSSPNLSIKAVGTCFRFSRKMKFRTNKDLLRVIAQVAQEALDKLQDFDTLQSYHIAELCYNLKGIGSYTGNLMTDIQKRSLDLLRGQERPLHIQHITNLLFAFTVDTSPAIKKQITELLIQNIDDADVLVLSNVADCITELGLQDPELTALFQRKVLQNIETISKYITRLVKVLRAVKDMEIRDAVFNQKIAEVLLKNLSSCQRYDTTFVTITARFILPTVRTLIPNVLMESLISTLPRCNLSHTLDVLGGLEKMKGPWLRSLHGQVLQIRAAIQQNIHSKVQNATQANQLAHLVKRLHIGSKQRDFILLDHIMNYYPRLTKSMTRHDYGSTLHVFKRLSHPYYHPEVFEDLIAYMKSNLPQIGFSGVHNLVSVLAHASYRPQDFDSFVDFTVQVLTDAMEEENYIGQVSLAHCLSILQIFPDNVLGQIFTFDYLEEIGAIIEAEPDHKVFLRNLIMQLNRSVILECPHLDVPWFHQHYCQEQEEKARVKDFPRVWPFVEEAENIVQEVLGGPQYVRQNVYSPYFHPINFEIVLDGEGRPLPQTDGQQVDPTAVQYERVALQLIFNQHLCANSQHRRGVYARDRRHLEILGYRVEEVSRYEWNSMALSDRQARTDFVRAKIFRSAKTGHSGELFYRLESSPP